MLPCRGRLVEGASERGFKDLLPPPRFPPPLSCLPKREPSPHTVPQSGRFLFRVGVHPGKGLAGMVGAGPLWLVGGDGKETWVKRGTEGAREQVGGASAVGGL